MKTNIVLSAVVACAIAALPVSGAFAAEKGPATPAHTVAKAKSPVKAPVKTTVKKEKTSAPVQQ